MHIRIIIPTPPNPPLLAAQRSRLPELGAASVDFSFYEVEAPAVLTEFSHALNLPGTIKLIQHAVEDPTIDGIIIGCMVDPGLTIGKLISPKPVIGMMQACLAFALSLGTRFSIITLDGAVPMVSELVHRYKMEHALASIRCIKLGVHDIHANLEVTTHHTLYQAEFCVNQDGADVIILGYGAMGGIAETVSRYIECPVLDPLHVGIMTMLGALGMGITCRVTPPKDLIPLSAECLTKIHVYNADGVEQLK